MKKLKRIFIMSIVTLTLSLSLCYCGKNEPTQSSPQSEIIEAEIKAVLDSIIVNTHVPGLVAGVWAPNESIELIHTAGVADLETGDAISDEMVFRIGSNTKTFTVTVLFQLIDDGLINLDDTLSEYLPDFPNSDNVSVEMLTNMSSGIFNYSETEEFFQEVIDNPEKVWTTEELIAIAAQNEYYFTPGSGFHYSNSNTVIIGKIIEILTGNSLESEVRTRIIEPLGLLNTTYLLSGINIPGDNHSKAYYAGDYDPEFPECSEYFDISWAGAAGCITSTLYELQTYVKAMTEGDLLSVSMQEHRLASCNSGNYIEYGDGIFEYKGFYGHNGGLPGFTSLMMHNPEKNCSIIVWYNCQLNETEPLDLLPLISGIIYPELLINN